MAKNVSSDFRIRQLGDLRMFVEEDIGGVVLFAFYIKRDKLDLLSYAGIVTH